MVDGKELVASIIILNKNKPELLIPCLENLKKEIIGCSFEILIGDTGTTDTSVLNFYDLLKIQLGGLFRVIDCGLYNFSKNNNYVASFARSKIVIFLNNDTIGFNGWVQSLVESFSDTQVGISGCKLLYGYNDRVQHAGIKIFKNGELKYLGYHESRNYHSSMVSVNKKMLVPAVTGACLAIRSDLFHQVGGFDVSYVKELQDVDLCFSIKKLGYNVLYNPQSILYHLENASRSYQDMSMSDRRYFRSKWRRWIDKTIFQNDQFVDFNPREKSKKNICIHLNKLQVEKSVLFAYVLNLKHEYENSIVTIKTLYPSLYDSLINIDRCVSLNEVDDIRYSKIIKFEKNFSFTHSAQEDKYICGKSEYEELVSFENSSECNDVFVNNLNYYENKFKGKNIGIFNSKNKGNDCLKGPFDILIICLDVVNLNMIEDFLRNVDLFLKINGVVVLENDSFTAHAPSWKIRVRCILLQDRRFKFYQFHGDYPEYTSFVYNPDNLKEMNQIEISGKFNEFWLYRFIRKVFFGFNKWRFLRWVIVRPILKIVTFLRG